MINYTDLEQVLTEQELIKDRYRIPAEISFSKMATDSRKVETGDVFFCIMGYKFDGHEFAVSAMSQGAALIVVERKLDLDIPQLIVTNSRKAAALTAKLFFDDPTAEFTLIGITGTNGKTTTASILGELLHKTGRKTGVIGTLGYSIDQENYTSRLTTPDIIELNQIFQKMVDAEVEFVVMEVSSHSLYLDRVYELHFDHAVFTNLTRDHLDFHQNMENYYQAKTLLFKTIQYNSGTAHINIDDSYGSKLFNELECPCVGISFNEGDLKISNVINGVQSSEFTIETEEAVFNLSSSFIAKHNVLNITMAVSVLLQIDPQIDPALLSSYVSQINQVQGRLEAVPNEQKFSVYIEYAHTPDALDNVLGSLSHITKGKLICVFGAGGERDREKRPLMLKAALKHSDLTILTNDNPRFESPSGIIKDIANANDPQENFFIIRDRRTAIKTALELTSAQDILLIAGKGHEHFQYIADKVFPFDDKEVVEEILSSEKCVVKERLSMPLDLLQVAVQYGHSQSEELDEITFEHISTDSRNIEPNSLFFALKGDKFDGHDYVENVLKVENCWAVVNDDYPSQQERLIRVDNTLTALGELAKKYCSLFPALKIAITGSVGKTTTKEYLSNILTVDNKVLKTYSNENNLIGLPKTIFKLQTDHKYAIFELGSNQFGEIGRLADICNPDMAVITSIGASHLEAFQDEAGVFTEKKSLFDRKLKLRFFPGEDKRFNQYFGITFGSTEDCDYRISNLVKTEKSTEFLVKEEKFSIPTLYDTFTKNAVIAISLCKELAIGCEAIQKGLNKPLDVPHRMEILNFGSLTVLADCYNANPQSMKAALNFWNSFQPERPHTAILGDMLELGELAAKHHESIGDMVAGFRSAQIISVGELAKNYKAETHFDNVGELISSSINKNLPSEAVVLVKASHGIELEKFLERIEL